MKLTTLKLNNFQGITDYEINIDGNNATIYGTNASGKTTIFNAYCWLLFDSPSTGAKAFSPKTRAMDGERHHLEHSVEATFALDNSNITLRKVYYETYKKKRGAIQEEFTGHTTDYYIDGVPVKAQEYTSKINSLCDMEHMKILAMPAYFANSLSWQERREILLGLCGEVNHQAIIDSKPELKDLNTYLLKSDTAIGDADYHEVGDYLKIAKARFSEINKQLQLIPARIDEATKAIPQELLTVEQISEKRAKFNSAMDVLLMKKEEITSGNKVHHESLDISAKIQQAKLAFLEHQSEDIAELQESYNDKKQDYYSCNTEYNEYLQRIQNFSSEIAKMKQLRTELLQQYESTRATVWNDQEAICPTCGQDLPADRVQELKEQFNINKSQELQRINETGQKQANKDKLAEIELEQSQAKEEAVKVEARKKELEVSYHDLTRQIEAAKAEKFEHTDEFKALNAQLLKCQDEEATSDIAKGLAEIEQQLDLLHNNMQHVFSEEAKIKQADDQKARIKQLELEEKHLTKEYEYYQKGVWLCELYIKAKTDLVTGQINSKFNHVRFRLFVDQINGGIKEDCEVMIPSSDGSLIPYSYANNAGRINAGLEIIDALAKHWQFTAPVFVDNAESVIYLLDIDSQVIRLVVSEANDALEVVQSQRAGGLNG